MSKASTEKSISGSRALGVAVGRSHTAVQGWTNHAEWPYGPGPWPASQIPLMKAWAARTLSENPAEPSTGGDLGSMSAKTKVDIGYKLTQTAKLKIEIEKLRERYHSIDDCQARIVSMIERTKKELMQVADGLPFESDVKDLVRKRILQALQQMAR